MAISQIGSTESTTGGSVGTAGHSVNKPTGTAEGDHVFIFCLQDDNSSGAPSSTGFTRDVNKAWINGSDRYVSVLHKKAGGSEPSSYTVTYASQEGRHRSIHAVTLRGVDDAVWDTTPNNTTHVAEANDSNTITPASISVSTAGSWAFIVYAIANEGTAQTSATLSGYDSFVEQFTPNEGSGGVMRKTGLTAGTETPGTLTLGGVSAGSTDIGAFTVVVKAASDGGVGKVVNGGLVH